jgi:hypothetical protein
MQTKYNKIHNVTIEEQDFPGMVGESQTALVIVFPDDNPDQYVNNQTLQFFEQDDREILIEWLNRIAADNLASARSFIY